MRSSLFRQRGVSLVTAIFLLVVLAGLAVAMVSLATIQHRNAALDVTGARAYFAATSGLEWGIYGVLRGGLACDGAERRFPVPVEVSGTFYVGVVCNQVTQLGIVRNRITATACNASGACTNSANSPDYVQRVVSAEF